MKRTAATLADGRAILYGLTAAEREYPAGSEGGMGVFINDIAPAAAAARLRELAPRPRRGG